MSQYPRFACFRVYNDIMNRYYIGRHSASPKGLVAYVTSGAPVEILEALGVVTIYPENYSALCGARRVATSLCEVAESLSYPADLCSYTRAHIGAIFPPDRAPLGGLPEPDFLVCCNNICGTVLKWYQMLADYYKCPMYLIDVPFRRSPKEEAHIVGYVAAQIEAYIGWLEKQVGVRLDEGRFIETLDHSRTAVELWTEIRELGTHRPSPINVPDLFLAMAPIVVMRGTKTAVDFYKLMKEEVEERIADGVAAVPGERIRLLWDNIAIWYRLFRFFRMFADQGVCFVADTYTQGWSANLELDDPILGLARVYATPFINLDLDSRLTVIGDLVQRFKVDGMVMHANRSCKPFSLTQLDIKRVLWETLGLQTLVLEADMVDARQFNEGTTRSRVAAFMEVMASH